MQLRFPGDTDFAPSPAANSSVMVAISSREAIVRKPINLKLHSVTSFKNEVFFSRESLHSCFPQIIIYHTTKIVAVSSTALLTMKAIL